MRSGLLIFCLLASLASTCSAFTQKHDTLWIEILSCQPVRFSHGLELSGCLHFRQYPAARKTKYSVSEFYLHPMISDELKLSPAKRTELKSAFEERQNQWQAWNEKLLQLSKTEDLKQRKAEMLDHEDRLSSINTELAESIRSALSNSQEKRLRQIQLRFLVHQNGFFQTFNNDSIGKVFGIPPLDAGKFKKHQQELSKQIFRKNRGLANEAFSGWLDDFDEEKRKVFDDRWGAIMKESTGTQQLILQLNPELEPTEFSPENPFDLSKNWPEFQHDATGLCIVSKQNDSKANQNPLPKFNWLHSFVFSEHFKRDVELVDQQVAMFKELAAEFQKRKWVINHEVGKRHNIKPRVLGLPSADGSPKNQTVYRFTTTEQQEDFEEAMTLIANEYYEKYISVLLPHQMELVEVVVNNMNTRLQGPLAELLWGDVGQALELTDDDKDSLKKKAAEAREFLEIESKLIYDDAIVELVELIPSKDRPKFRDCLGRKFKSFSPNLDGFASALTSRPVINEDIEIDE